MDRAIELDLGLKHEWANLGDVRLHYVSGGQGPAVVFLHGWPQTWYMWRDVLPGLMHRYRVIPVDLPALVVCGREDALSTVEEMRGIAARLPQARFVEIAGAGHMSPVEQPQAVNAAIRDFLAKFDV